jgi:hypothetical protein
MTWLLTAHSPPSVVLPTVHGCDYAPQKFPFFCVTLYFYSKRSTHMERILSDGEISKVVSYTGQRNFLARCFCIAQHVCEKCITMRVYIPILKLRKEVPWMVGIRRSRLATFPSYSSSYLNQRKALVASQDHHVVMTANIPVNRKAGPLEGTVRTSNIPRGKSVSSLIKWRGKEQSICLFSMAFV